MDLTLKVGADIAKFNAEVKKMNSGFTSLNNSVKNLAAGLGIAFGVDQLVRSFKYSINVIKEFEYQMDTVRAITGATGKEFAALKKNALDLGGSTEYTAKQVAELQTEFGRLGFSSQEIIASTKATLNLATATGENLARSAEIAGSTLRGFQLHATEMGRVIDVMTASFNKSALGLDSFAESIKYVSPVAKSVGASIEETTALLSVLADAGIKGSMAGTALRRIFSELSKDGRPLIERLKELSEEGLTLAGAQDEVGAYAKTALLVLTAQTTQIEKLTGTYKNVAGESQKVAAIMRDNLAGDFKILQSAIDGAILKGEGLISFFRKATQGFTGLVSILSNTDFTKTSEDYIRAEKAIKDLKKMYDDAVSSGQRDKAMQYAKAIAQFSSSFGWVKDKAVEWREEIKKTTDAAATAANQIKGIDSLTRKKTTEQIYKAPEITDSLIPSMDEMNKRFAAQIVPIQMVRNEVQMLSEAYATLGNVIAVDLEPVLEGIAVSFGEAIGAMLVGAHGIEAIGSVLLGGIGDIATALGRAMIEFGVAAVALKALVKNPATAIAAGVALVALGAALKSKASSIVSGGGGAGGGGSSGTGRDRNPLTRIEYLGERINLTGEFKVKGQDLVAVITNQNRRDSRLTNKNG